ncbi:hypothetical protein EJ110_NYTH35396 [Nymphaea thermarum]|nr:hypothetical protein EJ110_NYTH35396 [Nymphaea thermarum]
MAFKTFVSTGVEPVSLNELYGWLLIHEFLLQTSSDQPTEPLLLSANFAQNQANNSSDQQNGNYRGRNYWNKQKKWVGQGFLYCNAFSGDEKWYPDLGTSHHITKSLSNMSLQSSYQGMDGIRIGNGSSLPIDRKMGRVLRGSADVGLKSPVSVWHGGQLPTPARGSFAIGLRPPYPPGEADDDMSSRFFGWPRLLLVPSGSESGEDQELHIMVMKNKQCMVLPSSTFTIIVINTTDVLPVVLVFPFHC